MSTLALRSYGAWQAGLVAVAALVGLVAGVQPVLGIALAFGTVYVVLVVQNLALGLAVFAAITFMESISGVGELSAAKAAGGLLVVGWLGTLATGRERSGLLRDHPVGSAAIIVLGTWALLSAAWAELPGVALGGAQRWILNLAMFAIVYTAVREPRHIRWVLALFVVGALLSAALGLVTGAPSADAVARLEGSGVNANELGLLLIVAVAVSLGFGACRDIPAVARAAAFGAAALALVALLTTASRGAVVGLLAATCIAPLFVGKGRRAAVVALIALAVGGAASYLVTVAPAQLARISDGDATGSGRTDIWRVGWRIVEDKPIAGVGADNYANSTIHYLLEPGGLTRSENIVDRPKAAHNVYLQVLAELGTIGFALFLAVVGFALRSLLEAARIFGRLGDRSMDLLCRALLCGLLGQLAALVFSTALYSKQLWLLLAVSVAAYGIALRREADYRRRDATAAIADTALRPSTDMQALSGASR